MKAALRSAGAGILATDLVMSGEVENAFCAIRPPGHHAEADKAMGFCFFNNVAVAARHALEAHGLKRVAIIDFDVHHGNGTENIFKDDPRVLMVSIFQHPFYPYSGESLPSRAFWPNSAIFFSMSAKLIWSALRRIGTTRPRGEPTAMPMSK